MEEELDNPLGCPAVDGVVDVALRTDETLEESDEGREESAGTHSAEEGFGEGLFGTVGDGNVRLRRLGNEMRTDSFRNTL